MRPCRGRGRALHAGVPGLAQARPRFQGGRVPAPGGPVGLDQAGPAQTRSAGVRALRPRPGRGARCGRDRAGGHERDHRRPGSERLVPTLVEPVRGGLVGAEQPRRQGRHRRPPRGHPHESLVRGIPPRGGATDHGAEDPGPVPLPVRAVRSERLARRADGPHGPGDQPVPACGAGGQSILFGSSVSAYCPVPASGRLPSPDPLDLREPLDPAPPADPCGL